MIKDFILYIIFILDKLIKKDEKLLVFSSQPDLDDNSFAFFKYIIEEKRVRSKLRVVWLIDDINSKTKYIEKVESCKNRVAAEVSFVKKNSLLGVFYYVRSRYVFFTHGIFLGVRVPKNHIVVNLWHGMPIKNIGYLNTNTRVVNSSVVISTSKKFQEIMSKAFQKEKADVLITGQPRCDFLSQKVDVREIFNIDNDIQEIILWMPTYRNSTYGEIRLDGNFSGHFPILDVDDLYNLSDFLKKKNYFLLIKVHIMDHLNNFDFPEFSNIKIIKSKEFMQYPINLYELLGNIDLLLTDFSSVYIDFLLTLKPIAFLFDDFDDYISNRGFVFNNIEEYMPAISLNSLDGLKRFLNEVFVDDSYVDKRVNIRNELHDVKSNFSKELYDVLSERYNFLDI